MLHYSYERVRSEVLMPLPRRIDEFNPLSDEIVDEIFFLKDRNNVYRVRIIENYTSSFHEAYTMKIVTLIYIRDPNALPIYFEGDLVHMTRDWDEHNPSWKLLMQMPKI